jgi:hypothetical protein
MHGIINKACMEKFKPLIKEGEVYIITNVRVTTAAQKYRPVENDKVVNFLPSTNIKKVKDTQDIPKYSFQFLSTGMLSNRVNMDMYLSGKLLVTLYLNGIPLNCSLFDEYSYLCIIDIIRVAAHINWTDRRN